MKGARKKTSGYDLLILVQKNIQFQLQFINHFIQWGIIFITGRDKPDRSHSFKDRPALFTFVKVEQQIP